MANRVKPKSTEETPPAEATPDALPLSQSIPVVSHEPVSEGEVFEDTAEDGRFAGLKAQLEGHLWKDQPEAPAEEIPLLPYVIEELGIQPVALASKTWASDFGPGGAARTYKTAVYGEDGAIVYTSTIKFHSGPMGEGTPNTPSGMADSTLLSIVADRLTAFQAGPFASEETGKALDMILEAASLLNARTREREARGVQGKHEA